MKKVMNFSEKIANINVIIGQANRDDIQAIEPDSTWESMYTFQPVKLLKTKIIVTYEEYNGQTKLCKDSYQLSQPDDVNYVLSWIRRSIRKGYKYAAAEAKRNDD